MRPGPDRPGLKCTDQGAERGAFVSQPTASIVAENATVRRVARPRGNLTPDQLRRLERSAERRARAEVSYRSEVLAVMAEGASFAEVSKVTGLSTNTLQRWKREAIQTDDGRQQPHE